MHKYACVTQWSSNFELCVWVIEPHLTMVLGSQEWLRRLAETKRAEPSLVCSTQCTGDSPSLSPPTMAVTAWALHRSCRAWWSSSSLTVSMDTMEDATTEPPSLLSLCFGHVGKTLRPGSALLPKCSSRLCPHHCSTTSTSCVQGSIRTGVKHRSITHVYFWLTHIRTLHSARKSTSGTSCLCVTSEYTDA